MENPVKLTEQAASKVKEIMAKEGLANQWLRVGIRGGGCSGFEYVLDFTDKEGEADLSYESEGVKVLVDEISAQHLAGTTISYLDGLNGTGFKFENPNAQRTCGCGQSFS